MRCPVDARPRGRGAAWRGAASEVAGRRRSVPRNAGDQRGRRRRRRGANGGVVGGGDAGHTAAGGPRGGGRAGGDTGGQRAAGGQRRAAGAAWPPRIAAMTSVVRRVATSAAPASRLRRAPRTRLLAAPRSASRLRRLSTRDRAPARHSPVRAVGGGWPVSRTTGRMAGRTAGPIGARTTGHTGGHTTGPMGGRTTGRTAGGHPWGRTAAPAATYTAAAGGAGEPPIEGHASRS